MGRPAWRARRHGGPGHQERDAVRAPEAGCRRCAARRRSIDGRGGPVRRRRQGRQPAEPERLRRRRRLCRLAARDRINEGYDVVVAQFGGPARVAAESASAPATTPSVQDRRGRGGAAQADRRAPRAEPEGKLAAGRHQRLWPGRLRAGRAPSSTPVSQNKTVPLAMNIAMLGGRADDASYDGRWDSGWYDLPSAADVAPTVLATWAPCPPPTRTTWRVRPCRAPLRCVAHRCARPWITSAWR